MHRIDELLNVPRDASRLTTIREVITDALLKPLSAVDPGRARLLRLRLDHLTYLSLKDLTNLQAAVREVERNSIEGVLIEAGCALGGSAIAISMAKDPQREFLIYDTFEMIPPPSERDLADVHERYEVIVSGKAKGLGSDPTTITSGPVADSQSTSTSGAGRRITRSPRCIKNSMSGN